MPRFKRTFKRKYGRFRARKRLANLKWRRALRYRYRVNPYKMVQPKGELKVVDAYTNTADFCVTHPVFQSIGLMDQGTTNLTRVGNQIYLKSLQISGVVCQNTAISSGSNMIRFVVALDKSCAGSVPSATDLFLPVTGSTNNLLYDPLNLVNRDRFSIIYDKLVPLTASTTAGSCTAISIFKRLNLKYDYTGGGATIASLRKNHVFVWMFTDSLHASPLSAQITYRTRFVDP